MLSTDPLYLSDMYCRGFEAVVLDVRDGAVCLDRSAFYPGGGGLPADRGVLAFEGRETPVTAVRRDGFNGPIAVELRDLPAGLTATRGVRCCLARNLAGFVLLTFAR